MIFVQEQPEPADFSTKVRTPGQAFLKKLTKKPTNTDFKKKRYWKECLTDLYKAYNGICAYSAQWIPPYITRGTVDHYIPKHEAPELAYEWSNYRLCTERMNNNKDNHLDVMDPFRVQNGWFSINFATFFIEPGDGLPEYLRIAVENTITRLKLNDDDTLVQERVNQVQAYSDGDVSFEFLKNKYPFIASELDRQGLREEIKIRVRKKPSS
jgi:5-methylcytosine-specific restriction endonuclease McrA